MLSVNQLDWSPISHEAEASAIIRTVDWGQIMEGLKGWPWHWYFIV